MRYVGYIYKDYQLNIAYQESSPNDDPNAAHAEALRFIEIERHTGLRGGVRAEIGHEIVITSVDDFDITGEHE
ncbi:MAG: hypothetical protein Q7U16_07630 [Agitococcus sp.]|nr:hypothetical protein [Agitococcus sp.]